MKLTDLKSHAKKPDAKNTRHEKKSSGSLMVKDKKRYRKFAKTAGHGSIDSFEQKTNVKYKQKN